MDNCEDVHTDFDAAFTSGLTFRDCDGCRLTTQTVALGELSVLSGALGVGDVFTGLELVTPLGRAIPPGSYPVDVAVVRFEDDMCAGGDRRRLSGDGGHREGLAAARVRFLDAKIAHWVPAGYSAGVDSGTCGFIDGDVENWAADEQQAEVLLKALESSAVGPSARSARIELGGRVVFAFTSGLGDGLYPGYWGMDNRGRVAAYCLDFDLLVTPVTLDVPIQLPLRRGAIRDDRLRDVQVDARVPWFRSSGIEIECRGAQTVLVRYRSPDGRFTRVQSTQTGVRKMRVDVDRSPLGSELVLRVVIGYRPMSPAEG